MKVYRSQWWYKNKTWFSDFPYYQETSATDRLQLDTKELAVHAGIKLSKAKGLVNLICKDGGVRTAKDPLKDICYTKYHLTMRDLGLIETKGTNILTVMS